MLAGFSKNVGRKKYSDGNRYHEHHLLVPVQRPDVVGTRQDARLHLLLKDKKDKIELGLEIRVVLLIGDAQ